MEALQATAQGFHHRVWAWPGPTDRLPVVALHGFTGTGRDFAPLVARLGRTVLAPDLIGHGETEAPLEVSAYRMEQVVDQLADVLDATAPPGPCILVGYSMGGRTALHLVHRISIRVAGLVLIGAHPGLQEDADRQQRVADDTALATEIEHRGIPWFQAAWAARPIIATQQRIAASTRQEMTRHRSNNRPHGLAQSLRGMGLGAMPSAWPQLPDIPVPCRVVVGADDERFRAISEQMVDAIPQAERLIVDDAGHCAHLERPQATCAGLADFFATLDARFRAGDG